MKMNNNIKFIAAFAATFLFTAISCLALCRPEDGWKEKMKAQKVAFFTSEMDLSPDEAAKFWPIYNKIEKERDVCFRESFEAYKALEDAIAAGKSEKEVSSLLDKYLTANSAVSKIEAKAVEEYKKVISVEKIARLYIAEERFRRDQIHRLRGDK